MRRNGGDDDWWMRLLKRPDDRSLPDLADDCLLRRDGKVFSGKSIRRLSPPDIENHIDAFQKHLIAIFAVVAESFRIRHQAAWTDAHNEPSLEQVIEHRDLSRNRDWVCVRHVDRAGAEHNVLRFVCKAGKKHRA